jgi:hypothetical protein
MIFLRTLALEASASIEETLAPVVDKISQCEDLLFRRLLRERKRAGGNEPTDLAPALPLLLKDITSLIEARPLPPV